MVARDRVLGKDT